MICKKFNIFLSLYTLLHFYQFLSLKIQRKSYFRTNKNLNPIIHTRPLENISNIIKWKWNLRNKENTLIHTSISHDIRKLIFNIPCGATHDDKLNFYVTEKKRSKKRKTLEKKNLGDTELSNNKDGDTLTIHRKLHSIRIGETISKSKIKFHAIRTKRNSKDTANVYTSHIYKKTQTSKFETIKFVSKKDHIWNSKKAKSKLDAIVQHWLVNLTVRHDAEKKIIIDDVSQSSMIPFKIKK